MKLIKVNKKDATQKKADGEKDIIIEKLAKAWGGLMDAKVRLKKSEVDEYRKYAPACEKMADQIDQIMKVLNKGAFPY